MLITLNSPTNKKNPNDEEEKENVDFAAILTGREEVPKVDTLDTALATFQSNKKDDDNKEKNDLKFSIKITDMSKIKEVHIYTGKPSAKGDVVADLYKSETPSGEVVMDNISEGKIKSKDLKGPLEGKSTQELVRKMEKGEAYVDISTADKPKGKVRGKIKKLAPPSER